MSDKVFVAAEGRVDSAKQTSSGQFLVECARVWSAVPVLLFALPIGLVSKSAARQLVKVAGWVRGSR